MPIVKMFCREYSIPTESTFFSDLLRAAKHALYEQGTSAAKRNRLTEHLVEMGIRGGQGRVVFFADEAQHLHESHYKWLMDVHNELKDRGIDLIVLHFGQDELRAKREAFRLGNKRQITDRFMVHQWEFHGLTSAEEIEQCLICYDEGTEFPADSRTSFTMHYFPKAFDTGWRLARLSNVFMKAFRACRLNGGADNDIPMQYFCRSVERFLLQGSTVDLTDDAAVTQAVVSAIKFSGYADIAGQTP